MAAGPATRVSDVIVPELFTPYSQLLTEQKSRLVQSGLLSRSPVLDNLLTGGGITFNVPSFQDLDNDDDRISSDTSVPFAGPYDSSGSSVTLPSGQAFPPDPRKIKTLKEIAVRLNRNNSWSSTDLAAVLAGADPMQAIADRVASYWARRLQAAFIATWNGVIADNANTNSSDYANDLSGLNGGVFADGVTNFSAEAFLDAAQTMGDSQEDLRVIVVHSVVYNRMQKNNLIDFIPDARGEVSIPTFLGREVIIDDGMPRSGQVYDSWLFGGGATQFGVGTPPVATEPDRKPGGGNGGGQDVLYSRVMWTIHPTGHAWVGTAGDGGPANTGTAQDDLDEASSWSRVYPERKQIKFARLVTREA